MTPPSKVLTPAPGYTPLVGALVAMLTYTRATTLAAVDGLTTEQLDHRHDAAANPIGALLAHVAAIEWAYLTATLDVGDPASAAGAAAVATASAEWATWGPLIRLGPDAWTAARGVSLDEHVARLGEIRARTLDRLRAVDDAWLEGEVALPWLRGEPATRLWMWYHVMEDELNHRGQMRWLRGRLAT